MKYTVTLIVLLLLSFYSIEAHGAIITLDQSTILDASNTNGLDNYVVVRGANPPTVVSLLPGTRLNGDSLLPSLDAYDDSVINLQGDPNERFDRGLVRLNDTVQLTYQGAGVDSRVTVEMYDESVSHYVSGWAHEFRLYDDSYLRISGGVSYGTDIRNQARVRFSGGFTDTLLAFDDAILVWDGGTIGAGVKLRGDSRGLLAGGNSWETIEVMDDSRFDWRSGQIGYDGSLWVKGNGEAHIYGFDLRYEVDQYDEKVIAGRLSDGTEFKVRYFVQDQGQIVFHQVPEPGTLALWAVGFAMVVAARASCKATPQHVEAIILAGAVASRRRTLRRVFKEQ